MDGQASSSYPTWFGELCARLSKGNDLHNLNLNLRRLDRRMMALLSESLRNNCTLRVLNLTGSLSSEGALEPLGSVVLPHHDSIQVLHLSYNAITDVSSLGAAFSSNKSLREVYLDHNRIDSHGARCFSEGLVRNTSLKILCLGYNQIGDSGSLTLAKALCRNESLEQLTLERNAISCAGAQAWEGALSHNVDMKLIRLDYNPIARRLCDRINILCRANEAGRKFLPDPSLTHALWTKILARVSNDRDVLYYFLRARPDLCNLD